MFSSSYAADRSRPVAIWLFLTALLVLAMVVVGGATRLTDSGLSITEWKPVTGVLPPLSDQAWAVEFAKYQRIPQYQMINQGMSLEAFKGIFWWEWAHRLLGRVVGAAFALPMLVFLALNWIPRRLVWRCWALFGLGGLQGLVGWWMVSSGLAQRVSVAPERLTVHLGLALFLYACLIWTALEAAFGAARSPQQRSTWPQAALGLLVLVYVQSLLGALVAGNDAGLVYNDWPLMNGSFFPKDYTAAQGFWPFHAQAAVQFHHRIGAYILLALVLVFASLALRAERLAPSAKALALLLAVSVCMQAGFGIVTLMARVPVWMGVVHQAGAALVLAAAVWLAWRARRA
jgi:cytochrome c oxidase assembly protein subunit 15